MSEMKVDHGGVDILVAQQTLNGMNGSPGFDEMGGKGMSEGVDGRLGDVQLLASNDDESLEGGDQHRLLSAVHAGCQIGGAMSATSCAGKEQERMLMEKPVTPQILDHGFGDGDHSISATFSIAHPQLALITADVMNGEVETLGEAQTTTVDELDRNAITPQPDVMQELHDLITSHDRREFVLIAGVDL